MKASSLTHEVLCIGAHAPDEHSFPTSNATAVHHLFAGGLGPERMTAQCLTGPRATTDGARRALENAAARAAKYFVLYYSGRSSAAGFHLADGTLSGDTLQQVCQSLPSKSILVVLDVVIGTQPDPHIIPRWARALVEMREGMRIAAARATRIGAGSEGAGLSRFTAAFLDAMLTAPADVTFEKARYISDQRALEATRANLNARWGVTHQPIELGDFGKMPLLRSQAAAVVGKGTIEAITVGVTLSASIAYSLEGRAQLATEVHYQIEDLPGTVIGRGTTPVVADKSAFKDRLKVRFPARALSAHPMWGPVVRRGDPVHVRWRVSVRDALDRVLDEKVVDQVYVRPRRSSAKR